MSGSDRVARLEEAHLGRGASGASVGTGSSSPPRKSISAPSCMGLAALMQMPCSPGEP